MGLILHEDLFKLLILLCTLKFYLNHSEIIIQSQNSDTIPVNFHAYIIETSIFYQLYIYMQLSLTHIIPITNTLCCSVCIMWVHVRVCVCECVCMRVCVYVRMWKYYQNWKTYLDIPSNWLHDLWCTKPQPVLWWLFTVILLNSVIIWQTVTL